MLREKSKWKPHKDESADARHRGGVTRSGDEVPVMGTERRGYIVQLYKKDQPIYPKVRFDFLGFTFQPRLVRIRKGRNFVGFNPGMSQKSAKKMRAEIRSWGVHPRSDKSIKELSSMFNPKLRGWVNYYGSFYRSVLYKNLMCLSVILAKWAMRKYKRFRAHQRRAGRWLGRIQRRSPYLFTHWQMTAGAVAGR